MIRSKIKIVGLFAGALTILSIAYPAHGLYQPEQAGNVKQSTELSEPVYREGEVLVKFKKSVTLAAAKDVASVHSLVVAKEFKFLSQKKGKPYLLLRSKKLTTQQLITLLQNDSGVEVVSPNYIRRICAIPNDPYFGELWGLHNTGQVVNGTAGMSGADIKAPAAWDRGTGSAAVVVAVIDTGVDYTHEDLAANMWVNPGEISGNSIDNDGNGYIDDVYGINAITLSGDPMDDNGHGTHTSGTIAAVGNNGIGITGVNWTAGIMALKFLDFGGSGYDADAITCLEYVTDMKLNYGVNVVAINASWGGGGYNELLKDAIEEAGDAGIVFCASAGNGGWDGIGDDNDVEPVYPASYDLSNIIAVAATDQDDNLAGFSNYGLTSVDLGAPGTNILSTLPGGGYIPADGDRFFDNVEGGVGSWIASGENNTWTITTEDSYAGTRSWTDSEGSEYLNNTNSYLTWASNIDLSDLTGQNVYLGFHANVDLEFYFDYLYVAISKDGGDNWTNVGYINGEGLGWQLYNYKIPADFLTSQFRMRFNLYTDISVTYNGVYLDNIGIGIGGGSNNYAYYNGTSMAAPHVTGAVALVSSVYSAESVANRINRILAGADQLSALSGKTVTGGRLNLFNSLLTFHRIIASAGLHGVISPSGTVYVGDGDDRIFTITPNVGYHLATLLVDDVSQDIGNGTVTGYTFTSVTDDHTISVSFAVNHNDISGKVTQGTTTIGLEGVTITLSSLDLPSTPGSTDVTDTDGKYSFIGVAAGSYTLTPALTSYVFYPAQIELRPFVADAPLTVVDIVAYPPFEITVFPSGTPNPVVENGSVSCSVTAPDAVSYLWTADRGHFADSGGRTSDQHNPTWIADILMADNTLFEAVELRVTAYAADDRSVSASYSQQVNKLPVSVVSSDSGGCFIATAAFGTPLAKEVVVLKQFRDKFLLTRDWGKAFVRFYYRHSPSIAGYIRPRPIYCSLVRDMLRPLIYLVKAIS